MTAQIAIIGAGPYGLSIAAHLRQRNVPYRIFGKPLDSWTSHMPQGMSLKSDGFASSLFDLDSNKSSLADYCLEHRLDYHDTDVPVSLETFNAYALDFQKRLVPDLDSRLVVKLDPVSDGFALQLEDGEVVQAKFVVSAVGITHFAFLPTQLRQLPATHLSHSFDHPDLSVFSGKDIAVIGAGSSATETAALLHEAGARPTLICRSTALRYSSEAKPGTTPPLWSRLRHPSSGLGRSMRSWLLENFPAQFRYLPPQLRLLIVYRHLGPRSPWALKRRLEAVETLFGREIEGAETVNGRVELRLSDSTGARSTLACDHVLAATGYKADVRRLGFLSPGLIAGIRTHADMPILSSRFESSVRGLFFTGPIAKYSFGPLMRFMVGAKYAAPAIARHLESRLARQTARRSAR